MDEYILVIAADKDSSKSLIEYLPDEGIHADLAQDKETGIGMALGHDYSLIVMDPMLQERNGDLSVLQEIRFTVSTPIIVLSKRAGLKERIEALEMGADDYMSKPFNGRELVARMRAILRRLRREGIYEIPSQRAKRILVGDVEMDTVRCRLFRSGRMIGLTSVEFKIMEILLRNAGEIVSRDQLMSLALGRKLSAYDRSIDVHVSKLRKKLGSQPSGTERIKAIRGEGYFYTLMLAPGNGCRI
jgi:two-component system response regulator CpxR